MDLGVILRKARLHAGFSQEEIAEKLYLPRSTISKYENNRSPIKGEDLIRWFNITQAHELLVALFIGVDVPTVIQNVSQLLGGFILWI